jgi:hypothetical protein
MSVILISFVMVYEKCSIITIAVATKNINNIISHLCHCFLYIIARDVKLLSDSKYKLLFFSFSHSIYLTELKYIYKYINRYIYMGTVRIVSRIIKQILKKSQLTWHTSFFSFSLSFYSFSVKHN